MRRIVIFLFGVLALMATGCGGGNSPSPTPTPDPGCDSTDTRSVTGLTDCTVKQTGYYYIGTVFPMTGDLGSIGLTFQQAVLLAMAEINQAGGVDGKCLGMIACDSATDPATGIEAVTELVGAAPLAAIMGPAISDGVLGSFDIARDASMVMITPSGTSVAITDVDDDGFLFRTVVSDIFQGKIASAIADTEGFEKVFVINRDNAYGNGLREVFIEAFELAGGSAAYVAYDDSVANFENALVEQAETYDPDAVFLVAYVQDGVKILKKAISNGWLDGDPAWILTDGTKDPELITLVGNNSFLEGLFGTCPADHPTGSSDYATFGTAYQAAWNKEAGVFTAQTYDATYLLALAMAMSDDPDDGVDIRDSLLETSDGVAVHPGEWDVALEAISNGQGVDYNGASGPVDFDVNGDVLSNIEEWTITSGEIESVGCWTHDLVPCS